MRVIAVSSFTDASGTWHPYGHEFEMGDTPERAALVKAGTIREDDRMKITNEVKLEAELTAAESPAIAGVATPIVHAAVAESVLTEVPKVG